MEQRRKGLMLFLDLILNHPQLQKTKVVNQFMTLQKTNLFQIEPSCDIPSVFISAKPEIKMNQEALDRFRQQLPSIVGRLQHQLSLMQNCQEHGFYQTVQWIHFSKTLSPSADVCPHHLSACSSCSKLDQSLVQVQQCLSQWSQVDQQLPIIDHLQRQLLIHTSFKELFERRDRWVLQEMEKAKKASASSVVEFNQERMQEKIQQSLWLEFLWLHKMKTFIPVMFTQHIQTLRRQSEHQLNLLDQMQSLVLTEMPTEFI